MVGQALLTPNPATSPHMQQRHGQQKAPPPPPPRGQLTVTWPEKHRKHPAPKAQKKVFCRLDWNCCRFSATVV